MFENRNRLKSLFGYSRDYGFATKYLRKSLLKTCQNANIDIDTSLTREAIVSVVASFPIWMEDLFFNHLFGKRMSKFACDDQVPAIGGSTGDVIIFTKKYEQDVALTLASAYVAMTGVIELSERHLLPTDRLMRKPGTDYLRGIGYVLYDGYIGRVLPKPISDMQFQDTTIALNMEQEYLSEKRSGRIPGWYKIHLGDDTQIVDALVSE